MTTFFRAVPQAGRIPIGLRNKAIHAFGRAFWQHTVREYSPWVAFPRRMFESLGGKRSIIIRFSYLKSFFFTMNTWVDIWLHSQRETFYTRIELDI
jgi:hypothetical protein